VQGDDKVAFADGDRFIRCCPMLSAIAMAVDTVDS